MNYLSHRRSAMRSGKHCICNIKRVRALKSHTCEKGAAHLRITVWHLLMNLKNNYLLKNCWSGPIKNIWILIFTKKKIISHLCTKNLTHMIYSSWDIECDRMKLVFVGHFLPFYPTPPHPLILKKWKKLLEISSFYKCVPKSNHIRYGSIDKKWEAKFLPFWAIFWTFTPLATRKIKILIKWKKHLEMSLF